jgi:hypothetical protein
MRVFGKDWGNFVMTPHLRLKTGAYNQPILRTMKQRCETSRLSA